MYQFLNLLIKLSQFAELWRRHHLFLCCVDAAFYPLKTAISLIHCMDIAQVLASSLGAPIAIAP